MNEKTRFAQLLEERKVNLAQLRQQLRTKGLSRYTLYTHLHGQIPSNRTAIIYCGILKMSLDKFYKYLEG